MSRQGRGAFRSALVVVTMVAAMAVGAQQPPTARFPVASVGDSTFTFPVGKMRWVEQGQKGLAVDPRRNDGLVARFRVLRVTGGEATALVTGKTMEISSDHVALIEPRAPSWFRQRIFWIGLVVGGGVGAFAATR